MDMMWKAKARPPTGADPPPGWYRGLSRLKRSRHPTEAESAGAVRESGWEASPEGQPGPEGQRQKGKGRHGWIKLCESEDNPGAGV